MAYRAGLIGCGRVSGDHCRALQSARGVELVALADVHEPSLQRAGAEFGVEKLYLDYHEMLARERLDIVTVCTQAPQHAPVTIAAAQAGVKGIFCEKPIALTLAEADAMLAACERSGVRLAINHQTRMIPSVLAAMDLLREGAVGELRVAHLLDKGGRPAGNSLMELVTHLFDLLRIYAGDPAWVSAHLTVGDGTLMGDGPQRLATVKDIHPSQSAWPGDRDAGLVLGDRCTATFGFEARDGWHYGITATLDSIFQISGKNTTGRWHPSMELIGTDGALFFGGTSDHVGLFLHRGPWAPPGNMERIEPPADENSYVARAPAAPYHTAMVEELVTAIEAGREHWSNGRDGRWALEMIMGVYESHRRGGARVDLPLGQRDHPLQRWLDEGG